LTPFVAAMAVERSDFEIALRILDLSEVKRLGARTPRAPRAPAKSYARAYLM